MLHRTILDTQKILAILFILLVFAIACDRPEAPKDAKPGIKNMVTAPSSDMVYSDLDKEPNNSFLQASDIAFTSDEMTIVASLDVGDIDTYKIKAKPGSIAEITVTPLGEGDIILDISTSTKESDRIFYDNFAGSQPELVNYLRLSPQGVYFTVRARAHEKIAYRLEIRRMQSDIALEEEPNNSIQTAQILVLPSHLEASLNPQADVDYYLLSLAYPAVLNIEAPGVPIEVSLSDAQGLVWTTSSSEKTLLSSDVLVPSPKHYVLRIAAVDGFEQIASYKLSLLEASAMNAEREPNDSLETAQTLAPTSDGVNLSFLSSNDVDYFKLNLSEAPENAVFNLRATSVQDLPIKVELFDEDFKPIPSNNVENRNSVCALSLQNMSALIVKVSHTTRANLSYPLAYTLTWSTDTSNDREVEPNDLPSAATALAFDQSIRGNIFPASDIDVYKIEVPAVEGVNAEAVGQLQIQSAAGYVAGLRFKLQDAELYEISQAQSQVYSAPLRIQLDAPSGVYYLIVSGSGDGCVKSYEITASFLASEPVLGAVQEGAKVESGDGSMPENAEDAAIDVLDKILEAVPENAEAAPRPVELPKNDAESKTVGNKPPPPVANVDPDAF
ncbi:MAG: hypothetical protein WC966_11510 [Bradymonadales bacterium]